MKTIKEKKEVISITDRVKTYEDACKILEVEPRNFDGMEKDEIAYLKMKTIVKALNEGWYPKFTTDEYRWFPWYYLYTQKEIDRMSQDKRESVVLWGGGASSGALCGLASANSVNGWSSATAAFGSRLALKNRELARYFGTQFIGIIVDFVCSQKENNK
jgi:hypothetical protein